MTDNHLSDPIDGLEVAIIGLSARFPGAANIEEFWKNLRNGVESISAFTEEELQKAGVNRALIGNPAYVKTGAVLDGIDLFDAAFFDYSPREAEIMDPQHRLFLECAWEAIENAGYDSEKYRGTIGVFAGASMNTYLLFNIYPNRSLIESTGDHRIKIANSNDFLATRTSYKLGLEGPSIAVQSACSTSLVAVHLACQSLLNYQSDICLAGAVAVSPLLRRGYMPQEGGVFSPDGHCRAFDVNARGTIGGEGVGVIVLKRLADAIADRDCIHAVIKGSAINNDGSFKIGFTAPREDGQANVIAMALSTAGVDAGTISYVEAHGSGTALGDPIEIAALTQAFRASTDKRRFCAIGSVKSNIGHLDAAAGMAGLIKTVLSLKHKMLPPSLHFEKPNPEIDFDGSPFYVNTELSSWNANGTPRRAGVSSFGIGGTNAHVILEEAPESKASGPSRSHHMLAISAKTESSLERAAERLAAHLKQQPGKSLADVAYTLLAGRRSLPHKRVIVCRDIEQAVNALESRDNQQVMSSFCKSSRRPVAFMFSGLGDHYVNMGRGLYENEPVFREQVDLCSSILRPHLGLGLRDALYPAAQDDPAQADPSSATGRFDLRQMLRRAGPNGSEAAQKLNQTRIAQPAVFVVEYSLAKMWMHWGIQPEALIGYSLGEYVAACLAGVFSLEDALYLVARRAEMIENLPPGVMLAAPLPKAEILQMLNDDLSLSAVNGQKLSVISGHAEAVAAFEDLLKSREIVSVRLNASHAFHSKMMEPIVEPFAALVARVKLNSPKIPYISNVTGDWINEQEATDPSYWSRHLREHVRFADGLAELMKGGELTLLEIGPGEALSSAAIQYANSGDGNARSAIPSMRASYDGQSDTEFTLRALGKLWLAGAEPDWNAFYALQDRSRVALPTYPFERQRYWIEPEALPAPSSAQLTSPGRKPDIADWFYVPTWKQHVGYSQSEQKQESEKSKWLVFIDEAGLGSRLVKRLAGQGHRSTTVMAGQGFEQLDDRTFVINPLKEEDYRLLVKHLAASGMPCHIAHLWSLTRDEHGPSIETFRAAQDRSFYSLLFLTQAILSENITQAIQARVITGSIHHITGEESLRPETATVTGLCKIISQEYPNITCRSIDVELRNAVEAEQEKVAEQLAADLNTEMANTMIAYRGRQRWVQGYEAIRLKDGPGLRTRLRKQGVYFISGGLGSIGLTLAEYMARHAQAKLVLTGRYGLPPREEWASCLADGAQIKQAGRIRKIQELEALGAEVLVIAADASDESQMRAAIELAASHFGNLHGIIHAAGVVGERAHRAIPDAGRFECEMHFQPKAHGVYVLEKILKERSYDFCFLLSSLSPILGGLGFAAYASANQFMDSFVHAHNKTGQVKWTSLNWEGWRFQDSLASADALGASIYQLALSPEEGKQAFQRLLSLDHVDRLVISTGDLIERLNQWTRFAFSRNGDDPKPSGATLLHARPSLQNPYVAPSNDVELKMARMWQELLGIEQVGIQDNFFELGGNSLIGLEFIHRLRKELNVAVPLTIIYEGPTVSSLARLIGKDNNGTQVFEERVARGERRRKRKQARKQD